MTNTEFAGVEMGNATDHKEKYDKDDVVWIGNTAVPARDILTAWVGNMNIGVSRAPPSTLANPSPLGLCAFAATTFLLSLCNVSARHVHSGTIVNGMAFFYGGCVQVIAGICEFFVGNSFGFTALTSYGGFWLSFAAIQTPAFEILSGYTATQTADVLGFYLFAWFIFTLLLAILTVRTTVGFWALFVCLDITFLLLSCGYLTHDANGTANGNLIKAGGYFGIVTAFLAWYCAFAGLTSPEACFVKINGIPLPWSVDPKKIITRQSSDSASSLEATQRRLSKEKKQQEPEVASQV